MRWEVEMEVAVRHTILVEADDRVRARQVAARSGHGLVVSVRKALPPMDTMPLMDGFVIDASCHDD